LHPTIKKGNTMKHTLTAALLVTLALAGCASLPDSVRGTFAGAGHTQSDVDVQKPAGSPFPQATDQGKF